MRTKFLTDLSGDNMTVKLKETLQFISFLVVFIALFSFNVKIKKIFLEKHLKARKNVMLILLNLA